MANRRVPSLAITSTTLILVVALSGGGSLRAQEPAPVPPQLPAVTVTAKPDEFAHTTKYDAFFRRQRVGVGVFRTRDDIEKLGATDVASLLQRVPGVNVSMTSSFQGAPEARFRLARCPGQPPNIALYVNGHRMPIGTKTENRGSELSGVFRKPEERSSCEVCIRIAEVMQSVALQDLLFLEFYRGPDEMPAELDRGGSCAALVIWTR